MEGEGEIEGLQVGKDFLEGTLVLVDLVEVLGEQVALFSGATTHPHEGGVEVGRGAELILDGGLSFCFVGDFVEGVGHGGVDDEARGQRAGESEGEARLDSVERDFPEGAVLLAVGEVFGVAKVGSRGWCVVIYIIWGGECKM